MKQHFIREVSIVFVLISIIIIMCGTLTLVIQDVNAQGTVTCQTSETCHWLMMEQSDSYILCDVDTFDIEILGDDVIHLSCNSTAYDVVEDNGK